MWFNSVEQQVKFVHAYTGVSATLGLSATQMSARTTTGNGTGLAPAARRRPTGSRLAPAQAPGSVAAGLATLRTAFLDLQLANEASRGADWATLTSSGVPLPDPLDISAISAKYGSISFVFVSNSSVSR